MYDTDVDIQTKLLEIGHIVRELQNQTKKEWVSYRAIAKALEGSEEFSAVISSYLQLPQAQEMFATSRYSGVMLTQKGIKLLEQASDSEPDLVQRIAISVRRYAGRIKRQRLKVEKVSLVAKTEKHYVQAIQIDLVDNVIPSETPVEFYPENGSYPTHGRVVGRELDGNVLYVALEHQVHDWDLPAYLYIDHAYLLCELAKSIEMIQSLPAIAQMMFNDDADRGVYIYNTDSAVVGDMLPKLRTPWARYLWGPPGAGKTFALGRMCIELLRQKPDERILILAPSNLAVDNAVEQLIYQLRKSDLQHLIQQRKVLRFGYPRKYEILACPEVLGPREQDILSQRVEDLAKRFRTAEQENRSESEIAILRTELLAAQEALKQAVVNHVQNSSIVATTTTLAYLESSPISPLIWDTILVDEVTMVPPATCIYLSSRARKRVLLAGDPRQLGPVFVEGRRDTTTSDDVFEWMGRDVFDKGKISKGEGESREIVTKDRRLARITSQRRCTTIIWNEVEHLYPEVENHVDENRNIRFTMLPPLPGKPVVLIDTGKQAEIAQCTRDHHSWQNAHSAEVAMKLIKHILEGRGEGKISVAVITPYYAQVKLLRAHLKEHQTFSDADSRRIEVGTIHQFQGSEADVVIFDVVDGEPKRSLGKLLRDDIGLRLLNVAITRARGKLIVIANQLWCQQNIRRSENPLFWDLVMQRPKEERLSSVDLMMNLPVVDMPTS